jgi:hypothetical protein
VTILSALIRILLLVALRPTLKRSVRTTAGIRGEKGQRETEVMMIVSRERDRAYRARVRLAHGLGTTATNADERPTIARTSRMFPRPLLFVSFFVRFTSDSETF